MNFVVRTSVSIGMDAWIRRLEDNVNFWRNQLNVERQACFSGHGEGDQVDDNICTVGMSKFSANGVS